MRGFIMQEPEVGGDAAERIVHNPFEDVGQPVADVLLQFVHHFQGVLVEESVDCVTCEQTTFSYVKC